MTDVRMSEAEVSLRLANYLVSSGRATNSVSVALDGAQVKTGQTNHFNVASFMQTLGWRAEIVSERWQGTYVNPAASVQILIHSNSGCGDVTTNLNTGHSFIAEAKKGSINNSKSSAEYSLLREALGQLLTIEVVPDNALLAVAVPAGERFLKLAERWRNAPLIRHIGIRILTVARSGAVEGW